MKIKIEMEINHCYECPFTVRVYEQGYCGTDCSKCGPYCSIPDQGIREDCPFKSQIVLDKSASLYYNNAKR